MHVCLVVVIFLTTTALGEIDTLVKSGDTLTGISTRAGCGPYLSAKYNLMLSLNRAVSNKFANPNSIAIGTPVLIPDACLVGQGALPAGFRAVSDCSNGNGNTVCPSASSTCEETTMAFACACKPGFIRGTADVCTSRFAAPNNFCTKSCIKDPCSPNPCAGGTCTRTGSTFTCTCPSDTTLMGTTCVDQCAGVNCGTGGAGCARGACSCKPGFMPTADKRSCVDGCTKIACSGPTASCTAGVCSCAASHALNSAGVCVSSTSCDPAQFKCDNGQCVLDEANQRVCRCGPGMRLVSGACIDINECVEGTHECKAPARCVNTFGGPYSCACDGGLVLKNQFECGMPCPRNCGGVGLCVGGACMCNTGFVADGNEGCRSVCPGSPLECSGKGTCSAGSCVCSNSAAQAQDCSDETSGEGPGSSPAPSDQGSGNDDEGTVAGPTPKSDSTALVVGVSVAAGVCVWILLVVLYLVYRRKKEAGNSIDVYNSAAFVQGPPLGQYQQRPTPMSDRFHYGDTQSLAQPSGNYGDLAVSNRDQSFGIESAGALPPGGVRGYPSFQGEAYQQGQTYNTAVEGQQPFATYNVSSSEPNRGPDVKPYRELDRSEFSKYQQ
jgi:hypothetical protein